VVLGRILRLVSAVFTPTPFPNEDLRRFIESGIFHEVRGKDSKLAVLSCFMRLFRGKNRSFRPFRRHFILAGTSNKQRISLKVCLLEE